MNTQRNHIQNTHSGYSCPKCGETFESKFTLDYHIQNVHPDFHVCPECGEIFESEDDLEEHYRDCHYSNIYTRHPFLKWLAIPFPWVTTIAFVIVMIFCHDKERKGVLGIFLILFMFLGGIFSPTIDERNVSTFLKFAEVFLFPILAFIYLVIWGV